MMDPIPCATSNPEVELLNRVQGYLADQEKDLPASPELQTAWREFHETITRKIRRFALSGGAASSDVADCVQDVWLELTVRLGTFQLDPSRGKFESWLFRIVRSKTVNIHRSRESAFFQEHPDRLHELIDDRVNGERALETREAADRAWELLRRRLSEHDLQILQMRFVERLTVAETAQKLGISREQVRMKCHRVRRKVAGIVST